MGGDDSEIFNEGEDPLENFPLGKHGESIILRQNLEVSSGMLADRTFFRDFLPFKDITTIPAVPFHRSILLKCLPFFYIS